MNINKKEYNKSIKENGFDFDNSIQAVYRLNSLYKGAEKYEKKLKILNTIKRFLGLNK